MSAKYYVLSSSEDLLFSGSLCNMYTDPMKIEMSNTSMSNMNMTMDSNTTTELTSSTCGFTTLDDGDYIWRVTGGLLNSSDTIKWEL